MRSRGSMLVELSLGLLILILAIWLALDLLGGFQQRRRQDQFVLELRSLAAVFQARADALVAGTPDGSLPPAITEALKATNWAKGTPVGGNYEWIPAHGDAAASRALGTIAVTAFSPAPPLALTRSDLLYIDAALDDGNLATGRFRAGFNGWPQYLVRAGN